TTADGVRIAYATVGSGPAVVFTEPFSNLAVDWEEPHVRDFWETIAGRHTVIRYDAHGCGLSDRNRTDFSVDSEVRPIEAIVEDLKLRSFVLWARSFYGAAAIAYAVKFPDSVSHLILYGAQARWHGSPVGTEDLKGQEAFRTLQMSNWRMASL